MNYIDKILLSDEKLIYRSHPHWIIFFRPVISLLLAICAFYWGLILMADLAGLITLLSCLSALMVYYTSEFGITNQRVIIKLGFIRRYSFENALNRIEAVEVEQSILGRLLDYGTIRIRGVGGSAELFPAVPNPLLFRHKVQTQIERQRTI
ncbi:MAG: PH domain-containing protein [Candidatus Aquirickettsiella gammari]|jgi:uncharacterized membrane protein YdbT with pleckstrin-like domain|uniref:PH domain-containing protein n=1 Tax=Candidatus Aquirickettsiella gammari TaxID=2016198 RepID=A0A370CIW9_9COXI|nr:MAG: PH domain-containing protein [Candidatus Aquirickettsiella gammari]